MRPFVPFARDLGWSAAFAVALLWGVLAVSRSPSATLGILARTRARGSLATFALAFVMSSDVVVILLMAVATMVARPLLEPASALSFSAFHALGHEGLAGLVEREFPSFGAPFRALVIATLAINAVVGPIFFKLALDRSKETRSAVAPLAGEAAPA